MSGPPGADRPGAGASNGIAVRPVRPEERAAAAALVERAYAEYGARMAPDAWAGLDAAVRAALGDPGAAEWLVAERRDAAALGLHTSESMTAARALYATMGFAREPAYDFRPNGAELVEAYRLAL